MFSRNVEHERGGMPAKQQPYAGHWRFNPVNEQPLRFFLVESMISLRCSRPTMPASSSSSIALCEVTHSVYARRQTNSIPERMHGDIFIFLFFLFCLSYFEMSETLRKFIINNDFLKSKTTPHWFRYNNSVWHTAHVSRKSKSC